MDIHEYQAKALLSAHGVAVLPGRVSYSAEQAVAAATEIDGARWAVKAQIHAGGRGKAGGVKLCRSLLEVREAAEAMLDRKLVTAQTGPEGKRVRKVYVEAAREFSRSLYLALLLDRSTEAITILASAQGGVEIEELAARHPEQLLRLAVDPWDALPAYRARALAFDLGLSAPQAMNFTKVLLGAYRAFRELDATMLEINPLVVTMDDALIALDAKMSFDDNALFRRKAVAELRDHQEEDARDAQAAQAGLNYVGLDGDIGCVINGAGLAMATMDMIKHAGGEPANFLDVGGGASPERIRSAFALVLSDPNVKAILVNIFAGINRCDWVAEGVVQAARDLELPLVVRLSGTNEALGRKIIEDSGLPIYCAQSLEAAAHRVVEVSRRNQRAVA